MTILYNAKSITLVNYLTGKLFPVEDDKLLVDNNYSTSTPNILWYSIDENYSEPYINNKYIWIIVRLILNIINIKFYNISKLSFYLNNVSTICIKLNISIIWNLPYGL